MLDSDRMPVCFAWTTLWPHAVPMLGGHTSGDVRDVTCKACLHALGTQVQQPPQVQTKVEFDVVPYPHPDDPNAMGVLLQLPDGYVVLRPWAARELAEELQGLADTAEGLDG